MSLGRLLLAAALLLGVPLPLDAQAPRADTRLEIERRQRRAIVRPGTPADAVEHDTDRAVSEVEARERQRRTARALTQPAPRRPDLDDDVTGGIQSQRLNDALRRR